MRKTSFSKAIPSGLRPDAIPNVQSIKDDLTYFVGTGAVKKQFDVTKDIDLSYIQDANKQLGAFVPAAGSSSASASA